MTNDIPETQYALLGDDRVAYQVFGEGCVDLVYLSGPGESLDLRWDLPAYETFLRRLADFTRVITFDQRGTGGSDTPSGEALPNWERWADEARAVLEAAGSKRAVILGYSNGGPIGILFALSNPRLAAGLILGWVGAALASGREIGRSLPLP